MHHQRNGWQGGGFLAQDTSPKLFRPWHKSTLKSGLETLVTIRKHLQRQWVFGTSSSET